VAAAREALDSAHLTARRLRAEVRVSIGTSKPLVDMLSWVTDGSQAGTLRVVPPCTLLDALPDAPGFAVTSISDSALITPPSRPARPACTPSFAEPR